MATLIKDTTATLDTAIAPPATMPNGLQATDEGLWVIDQATEEIRLLTFRSVLIRHGFGNPCFPCIGQIKSHHFVRLALRATGNAAGNGEMLTWHTGISFGLFYRFIQCSFSTRQ